MLESLQRSDKSISEEGFIIFFAFANYRSMCSKKHPKKSLLTWETLFADIRSLILPRLLTFGSCGDWCAGSCWAGGQRVSGALAKDFGVACCR